MLWATRSRRCFSSAIRSLSSKTGAGGVRRIFGATGISLFARTAVLVVLNAKTNRQVASRAKDTLIDFIFVIWFSP
jgi:hypothetical protein